MNPSKKVDISAILAAVYRPREDAIDAMAARVRARIAWMETLSECARLLLEAPASAFTATLGSLAEPEAPEPEKSGG